MKLAISNIAWKPDQETAIADILQDESITGIEVAPCRAAPEFEHTSISDIKAYRDFWNSRGIEIVAMQALLFGAPPYQLFGDTEIRQALSNHLEWVIQLGGQLGARALVFGSPKQRQRKDLPLDQAQAIAVSFFRHLGAVAEEAGTCLCIEPNPEYYDCDFITRADQARELVSLVDHPGFGLHLDAAALRLAGEESAPAICTSGSAIQHFHISEPDLSSLGTPHRIGISNHGQCAAALQQISYENWLSIEMRAGPDPQEQVRQAIRFARDHYGGPGQKAAA